MPTLTDQQIAEIAEELDNGIRSFVHVPTGELLFAPDTISHPDAAEYYEEELEKLENNFEDYFEIIGPTSRDSFEVMVNYIEQLDDKDKIKSKLINALGKRKPFREFKFVLDDSSGDHREEWFEFKKAQIQQWVRDRLDELT